MVKLELRFRKNLGNHGTHRMDSCAVGTTKNTKDTKFEPWVSWWFRMDGLGSPL